MCENEKSKEDAEKEKIDRLVKQRPGPWWLYSDLTDKECKLLDPYQIFTRKSE